MGKVISKKRRVQRRRLFNAPHHMRGKLLSVHLSRTLREKYGRRSFPVRVGDKVLVLKGDYAGVEGKVQKVDRKKLMIYIEGLTRETVDGRKILIPIRPANLLITELNLEDEWRRNKIEGVSQGG